MDSDNRLPAEVMIALNALESARAWDGLGVTSQDVAVLAGMETGDLIDLTDEALNYCYERGRAWAEELADRDGRYQAWIAAHPEPKNNKADFGGNYHRRLQAEWERQDDIERKGD